MAATTKPFPNARVGAKDTRSGPIRNTAPAPARAIPPSLAAEARSCLPRTEYSTVNTGTVVTRMLALIALVRSSPMRNMVWFAVTPKSPRSITRAQSPAPRILPLPATR